MTYLASSIIVWKSRGGTLLKATLQWGFIRTKTVRKPEEEDRVKAVLDILKGSVTPEDVRKMYDITSINSVYTWIGKYVSQEKVLFLEEQNEEDMANKSKDDQIRELKARLKQAPKEAELERLRAHAYDKMIDFAEEKFNIPIRKKIWRQTVSLLREETPAYMRRFIGPDGNIIFDCRPGRASWAMRRYCI